MARPAHNVIVGFHRMLGGSGMLAYLTYMAERLEHCHRLLKPTGSLYLHCDPTASHYLKAVMDGVFGSENFRNEIIWQRSTGKSLMSQQLPTNHDILLSYQRSDQAVWNADEVFVPYDPTNLDAKTASKYRHRDPDGRIYRLDSLINPNRDRPNLQYEFLGVTRVWRWTRERMQKAYEAGLIVQSKPGRVPQLKRFLDEQRGRPLGDVWTDIAPINSRATERLGYQTQKPLNLLARIIRMSSREGDLVLDPFCGCGTTVDAAQRLGRRWAGIDISSFAIDLICERRMIDVAIDTAGIPSDMRSASKLAADDPFGFEAWAVNRLPGFVPNTKQVADGGIDGRALLAVKPDDHPSRLALAQVKGGKSPSVSLLRDFCGVTRQQAAAVGCYVTLRPSPHGAIAASEGKVSVAGIDYQRMNLWSIADYFEDRWPKLPMMANPYTGKPMMQGSLF
ncbi:MAG: DNA methyltransferase [Acidimicrobiaceae bacterium]|nr:DNA methyltransferase [Acidimicrobiaceae bacterium]MDE0516886.1 DNA methyltransferase [Acidimicrobiaceae bacterium]